MVGNASRQKGWRVWEQGRVSPFHTCHCSEEATAAETQPRAARVCHTVPCQGGAAVTTAQVASKPAQVEAGALEVISQFTCESLRLGREWGNK